MYSKPSKAVSSLQWGRVAPAVQQHGSVAGVGERHKEEFEEKRSLGCLGAG